MYQTELQMAKMLLSIYPYY